MRINSHILSIPPFISTSWDNIASLHVAHANLAPVLVVTLLNGTNIEIPELEQSILEAIFTAHAKFLEQEQASFENKLPPATAHSLIPSEHVMAFEIPLKSASEIEQFGALLQHNPEQADGPELPPDLICKIAHLSKSMGIEDPDALPQPEPHCNCTHCQIARAMQSGVECTESQELLASSVEEEVVSDDELTFRTWDIEETGDRLFAVTNPLDAKEKYSVYLGAPVGCTCGEKHCEHIQAVLKS